MLTRCSTVPAPLTQTWETRTPPATAKRPGTRSGTGGPFERGGDEAPTEEMGSFFRRDSRASIFFIRRFVRSQPRIGFRGPAGNEVEGCVDAVFVFFYFGGVVFGPTVFFFLLLPRAQHVHRAFRQGRGVQLRDRLAHAMERFPVGAEAGFVFQALVEEHPALAVEGDFAPGRLNAYRRDPGLVGAPGQHLETPRRIAVEVVVIGTFVVFNLFLIGVA